MSVLGSRRRIALVALTAALGATVALVVTNSPAEGATTVTTGWHNGTFNVDRHGVVQRSNIVIRSANTANTQSLPLGNGELGVAAWAAGGFTAQLNRTDTMPDRRSPGQVTIPGLSAMTGAANFTGSLDLYTGVLSESGGGMTMKAWVATGKDELVVDVTGANPANTQTAAVNLWSGRGPTAAASGAVGTLAETWVDNSEAGSSGRTFGSLAAITAGGTNVTASVVNPTKVQVSFKPNSDGSFRVVVGSPGWAGGNAGSTATSLFGGDATAAESTLLSSQQSWWAAYWAHAGPMEISSTDGTGEYMENLRTLYLYLEAASMKQGFQPGSQGGDADMFNFLQDKQNWTPSSYWLWNLRTQIAANMSTGDYALNVPIFDMYLNALPGMITWTTQQMGGLPGACLPETMRFNGNGGDPNGNASCAQASAPNWNALNISSGPELSLYLWQQYQATGDLGFLQKYYPIIKQTATFLLAYQKVGADGFLHATANAHETQWSVPDPTTDLTADQALFPILVSSAHLVGTDTGADAGLVAKVKTAENQIPPYARSDPGQKTLLDPDETVAEAQSADAAGNDVIAMSYQPAATIRNGENIGLEPLWPWNQVSDTSGSLFSLEQRSYANRLFRNGNDWDMDAIDAARLDMGSEVRTQLLGITEKNQIFVNGLADLGGGAGSEPYLEQVSGVATALDEALVQDYDGLLRIAPAWPSGWDTSATVYVPGNTRVDVQVENGSPATVAIEAGSTRTMQVRDPWPGKAVQVVDGSSNAVVVAGTTSATFGVPVVAGRSYLVEQVSAPTTGLPFAQITGTAPTSARHLQGVRQIGLDPAGSTGTAVIGTVLGATNSSKGVTQTEYPEPGDGATTAGTVGGQSARTSVGDSPAGDDNIYFRIDDTVAHSGGYQATFVVSYYDTGSGTISLHVDGPSDPYTGAGTITLHNTNSWQTATMTASGAVFGNGENASADFRLHSGSAHITVHSVQVTVTGPGVPNTTEYP